MPEEVDWLARVRQHNVESGRHLAAVPNLDDDDILIKPEDLASTWKPGPEDDALDAALARLGIIGAYQRWSDKSVPRHPQRVDGIMVSCPFPDHPDQHPSCWLNREKNVGNCGGCGRGFSIIDLYALTHGLGHKGYDYREVRKRMALDLGLHVRDMGHKDVAVEPEPADLEAHAASPPAETSGPTEKTTPEQPEPTPDGDAEVIPFVIEPLTSRWAPLAIDWRDQLDGDSTFLKAYLETFTIDWIPEEYHYWCAHVAIGAALGKDLMFHDGRPVKGGLYLCTVGSSGSGKTRAAEYLRNVLDAAFSWDPNLGGQRFLKDNGSGESLIADMAAVERDPPDPENPKPLPVRGLMVVDELATLATRGTREGSILKTKLMEFYDHLDAPVNTRSQKGGVVEASDHFLQLVTTTQPRLLDKLLTKDDAISGFVGRFLFVGGPGKEAEPEIPETDLHARALDKRLRDLREWALSVPGHRVRFDAEGRQRWHDFFIENIRPLKDPNDPDTDPVLARIDVLFKRLFLLHAADQHSVWVTKKIVDQVLTLWPYLTKSMSFIGEKTTMSAETRERTETEDAILACVYAHKGQITMNDLGMRCTNYLSRKHPQGRDGVNKALETLIKAGELDKDYINKPGKAGRPTTIVRAVRGNR